MEEKKIKLKVAHLYPKLLNVYGDTGNILALQKRCLWRNIDVEICEINSDENLKSNDFDFYFIGGGQDKQQALVAEELQKNITFFNEEATKNRVFLGICGGYQLFGKYYQTSSGEQINGLGILDVYTQASEKRLISNVCAKCDFVPSKIIVGFENHSGKTFIEKGTQPIATVITGNGNNGEDKTEGARKNNIFGTYLHGSFLPKNPEFADYLVELALSVKYNDKIKLLSLDNSLEMSLQKELAQKKF